ncbi:DUF4097 family beta strand repeat-containing protein [Vallitalea sp.]|jgi:hypothetical protein|uniref:DUF4097 family beta strand repeat-containing protein n=1 Tax=Vallitalea sp. TaxID=1882829 RepID=UPI0025FEB427|nr:DUF4097 family beta strand repeat-containing protein [Vallitalea sp.]MCT4685742.1 DUF4097 domain-containing protein [Vallitalea sp.]
MKKLKNMAIILSITLVVSFFGIIAIITFGFNPFYSNNNNHDYTTDNNRNNYDWLQNLPFVPNQVKDIIQDFIEESTHNSIINNYDHTIYNKTGDTLVDNFPCEDVDKISLKTDVAIIVFKKEDRKNIKVEYTYTKPKNNNYAINYNIDVNNNTLDITQRIVTKNFFGSMNKGNYTNDITVYVPNDFELDTLYINNNLGEINSSEFFSDVKNIDITSSLGKIDITLANYKESVILTSSMGKINYYNNAKVDKLNISSSSGVIYMESNNTIKDCTVNADMGGINIISNSKIDNCDLESDMGAITASFKQKLDFFSISSDMGSIKVDLYDNDNSIISTNVSMGKIKSDFPTSSKEGNYNVDCDMGDITIRKK